MRGFNLKQKWKLGKKMKEKKSLRTEGNWTWKEKPQEEAKGQTLGKSMMVDEQRTWNKCRIDTQGKRGALTKAATSDLGLWDVGI